MEAEDSAGKGKDNEKCKEILHDGDGVSRIDNEADNETEERSSGFKP